MGHSILNPILALICWSLLVWLLMYIRRLPAMQKAGIDPQSAQFPGSLNVLPAAARGAADNYNHLMEQPTIFYALGFYIHLSNTVDNIALWVAWAYVVLRVLHSLVQVSINVVVIRFSLFALSTLCLFVLAAKSLLALW
ncbi:MAPEG family protein [Parvularcula sp. IMCC14364]|uniref:MAPEG family protein n=1 Tax=Parvularcula sp. IMCC14364 TaxID=3067902 RepID=UPI0027419FAF|nr:MAPEG family protein [Parvularcula sp. IMCC14364]